MKVLGFLIADDVRQEVGGKVSVIGAYDAGITIGTNDLTQIKFPVNIPCLAFYMQLKLDANDPLVESFDADVHHDGKLIAKIAGKISLTDRNKPFSIFTRLSPFPLIGVGKMEFIFRFSAPQRVNFFEYRPDNGFTVSVQDQALKQSEPKIGA